MRKLIEQTGMTIREFSEYYSIPYNTVRQWYNGIAKCPDYLKKLIEENRELKSKGKQLKIKLIKKY